MSIEVSILEKCLAQVEASKAWFDRRVLPLSIEQLRWRPHAMCWSIAECLDHLNLTLNLYLPKIDDAIGRAGCEYRIPTESFWCEPSESEELKRVEPPVIAGCCAPLPTIPGPAVDPDWLVDQFHQSRDRYAHTVRRASGLDLRSIRIIDPIYPAFVSLGGTLGFLAAHDRRHMWQAERVRRAARFPHGVFERGNPVIEVQS